MPDQAAPSPGPAEHSAADQAPHPHIKIQEQGPYVVTGGPRLTQRLRVLNAEGEAVTWQAGPDWEVKRSTYLLCRCGHSSNKPFCDSTHKTIEWDGTLTADHAPTDSRRQEFEGVGMTMTDDETLCAGYAFCDRFGSVWHEIQQTDDPEVRERLKAQIQLCPSGRLQYLIERAQGAVELPYEPTIAPIVNGAYWVLGGIPVTGPDGFTYEVRNRQLLCRCGQSQNKPFCDGSHWQIRFKAP